MAKSKGKFNLTACITLITSLLGFIMFFLPNLQFTITLLGSKATYTSSGMNMLSGMFDIDNANEATVAMFDGTNGNGLAYIIAILFVISAIALLVCAVFSCLELLGVKSKFDLVSKIAIVASILLAIALIVALIRFGQIDGPSSALGYGLILGLICAIATAIVPMVIKK